MKLAEEVKEIAYEMDVFGVEGVPKTALQEYKADVFGEQDSQEPTGKRGTNDKTAAQKLYEYELGDFKFFSKDKIPSGFRLPVGKARWTKNYFPVSGQLAKGLEDSGEE